MITRIFIALLTIAALAFANPKEARAQAGARTSVASCPTNMAGTCSDLEAWEGMIIRLTARATPRALRMALLICRDVSTEAASFRSTQGQERTVNGGSTGGVFRAPEAIATPGFVLSLEAFCRDLNALVVEERVPSSPTYSMVMGNSAIERISAGAAMEAAVQAETSRRRGQRPTTARRAPPNNPSPRSPGMCRLPPPSGAPAPQPPPG